jgi:hypothetical protein
MAGLFETALKQSASLWKSIDFATNLAFTLCGRICSFDYIILMLAGVAGNYHVVVDDFETYVQFGKIQ